jgi:hypothetical protein
MKVTIDIKHFAIAILSFSIAILIAQGTIQKFVHFAGPENEMACFALAGIMGSISLFCSFEKSAKK